MPQDKDNAEDTHLAPLVLIEDEPVPGHWVDELDLETYARIVAGAAVGTQGPFTIGDIGSELRGSQQ